MNDEQLVELCKKGDKLALEQLIQRYYVPLSKFVYKYVRDPRACEDVTQEVVMKLIENIEKYRPIWKAKFSTWLFKIAYHTCLNYLKKRAGSKESELDETMAAFGEGGVQELVEGRIEAQNIHLKLNELSDEFKSLIILRYYQGFSYAEIGNIMEMHTAKVKWRLHQALDKLKDTLKRREPEASRELEERSVKG